MVLRFELLRDVPQFVTQVAHSCYAEWPEYYAQELSVASKEAAEAWWADTITKTGADAPWPFTIVAFEEEQEGEDNHGGGSGEAGSTTFVGCASVIDNDMPSECPDRRPWMCGVFTAPEQRGRGIGGRLIEALRDRATQRGIGELYLWTQPTAKRLYERHGWAVFRHVERYLSYGAVDIMRIDTARA